MKGGNHMKIVKYGHGMKCQKWYKTECSHCHTIFKASPFEVAFMEYDEETTHPTPSYKTTCPVCEYTDIYKLEKKEKKKKNKDKSENRNIFRILGAGIVFVLAVIAIVNLYIIFPDEIGLNETLCVTSLVIIATISLYALFWDIL